LYKAGKMKWVLFLIVVGVVGMAMASTVAPQNCKGHPNLQPIFTNPPQLVRTVANGKLYVVPEVSPPLHVVHLYGTPYQMGYAQGLLLQDQISKLWPEMHQWVYNSLNSSLDWLPDIIREILEEYGVAAALDATVWLTEPWTPSHFIEEIHGLADAVPSISYSQFYQVMVFPELIQARCSMYGAWGAAIANTTGSLYQLRALDWATNGPFQQFPVVLVYHPNEGNGHPFSIVSWAGFIGSLTGYSSAPMGVCEKLWKNYNGTRSRLGIPFHFLLRDILQYDPDTIHALQRIQNAARTCSIFVGLGDYTNTFVAVEYSYDEVVIWNEKTQPVYQNHPYIKNMIYIDKHPQPSYDPCLGSLLKTYYGKIDAVTTIRYITSQLQTGDMHLAVYDFGNNYMYVSNASPMPNVVPAYDRPFVRLDMAQLFSEKL
jgi:hypothetical protein